MNLEGVEAPEAICGVDCPDVNRSFPELSMKDCYLVLSLNSITLASSPSSKWPIWLV